jgi:hypothetical protein
MDYVDSIIDGLLLLKKYDITDICAEHDELFVHIRRTVEGEDRTLLENQGGWSEESPGTWHIFV